MSTPLRRRSVWGVHTVRGARGRARWSARWTLAILAAASIVSVLEAAVLEVGTGYFSSGYGGVHISGPVAHLAFAAASLWLDVGLTLTAVAMIALPLRLLGVRPALQLALSALAAMALPLSLDFSRHVLEAVLGRVTSFAVVYELAGRSYLELAAQSLAELHAVAWLALIGASGAALCIWLTRAIETHLPSLTRGLASPPLGALGLATLGNLTLGAVLLFAHAPGRLDAIQFGVARKPAALMLRALAGVATDFDRDGSGWLDAPTDPAPFDARIHPYAADVAGNGVDEDGIAGDRPADAARLSIAPIAAGARPTSVDSGAGASRHHQVVLLVLLESFRADLLGRVHGDREVTPYLNALARAGASSARAYAHTPHTFTSRAQLFGGTLAPVPGQTTLIDDFAALGFEVAHFSGQDDSFAGSDQLMHTKRADRFYDAQQDLSRRTGRGTSAGALQVSWKLLLRRIEDYLAERDPSRPLFLYVNPADTHFPYDHAELDDLIGTAHLARGDIRPENREQVRDTYANAAANVDRAVERIVASLRAHTGQDPAVLIVADHGEALYEDGTLGHGQALDETQTRIPWIVSGLGGIWPEPLGLADARGLLIRAVAEGRRVEDTTRATLVQPHGRHVFQYLSRIEAPRLIGARSVDTAITYDLLVRPPIADHDQARLVFTWESLRSGELPAPAHLGWPASVEPPSTGDSPDPLEPAGASEPPDALNSAYAPDASDARNTEKLPSVSEPRATESRDGPR